MKYTTKPEQKDSSSEIEEYIEKELEVLDIYQNYSDKNFLEDEIYDLIIKYDYDDQKIKAELDQMIKDLQRRDKYGWHEISKIKIIFLIYFKIIK